MSETQSVDHLRHHLLRGGLRAPGQVRDIRQGAQLLQVGGENHRDGGVQALGRGPRGF